MADEEVLEEEAYEGYIQIENGVGLLKQFERGLLEAIDEQKAKPSAFSWKSRKITIATGSSAYDFMKQMAEKVMENIDNLEIQVIKIVNNYFGETITVAGLITGTDLYEQLKDISLGDYLLLPRVMFRSDDLVFLDDITKEELEEKLSTKVVVSDIKGSEFLEKILN